MPEPPLLTTVRDVLVREGFSRARGRGRGREYRSPTDGFDLGTDPNGAVVVRFVRAASGKVPTPREEIDEWARRYHAALRRAGVGAELVAIGGYRLVVCRGGVSARPAAAR